MPSSSLEVAAASLVCSVLMPMPPPLLLVPPLLLLLLFLLDLTLVNLAALLGPWRLAELCPT
jgi:hypothetical protein